VIQVLWLCFEALNRLIDLYAATSTRRGEEMATRAGEVPLCPVASGEEVNDRKTEVKPKEPQWGRFWHRALPGAV
jgi:hypothetical protein